VRRAAAAALSGGALTDLREALAAPPTGRTDELAAMVDRARALGVPPPQYGTALEAYWTARAADEAGVDLASWDVTAGAEANRETVEAVCTSYAGLFLEDPDLEWAGTAALIGPSFAAGFFDLDQFRRFAQLAQRLTLPPEVTVLPEPLARIGEAELRFYETTLLSMQKEIVNDMAPLHQSYREGGVAALEELRAAGVVDPVTSGAWQHGPSGEAFTWALTLVGEPSIPGAAGYPDVFPVPVPVETPGPLALGPWDNPLQGTALVTTPFPDGNVADVEDRWALIEEGTLPAYRALLEHDPALVGSLLGTDVHERIDEMRTLRHRLDDIAAQLADWHVRSEQ